MILFIQNNIALWQIKGTEEELKSLLMYLIFIDDEEETKIELGGTGLIEYFKEYKDEYMFGYKVTNWDKRILKSIRYYIKNLQGSVA